MFGNVLDADNGVLRCALGCDEDIKSVSSPDAALGHDVVGRGTELSTEVVVDGEDDQQVDVARASGHTRVRRPRRMQPVR